MIGTTDLAVNHRGGQRATDSRLKRTVGVGAALAGVLGTAGCSAEQLDQWARLGMPEPVTDRAPRILELWQGSWIAALIIGAVVWGLILWAVVAYRKRDESIPPQTRYHLPIEILYTFVPFVIIAVLFIFTVRDQNAVLAQDANPDHEIEVVAFQWSWAFNYHDSKRGGTNVWETGTPAELPTLYLPKGESVRFVLNSPDVVHSFYVPNFLFKMDAFPGRTNSFTITPTKEGEFAGKCAELCGAYHSRMLFTVKVVSPDEYDAHLDDLAEQGQTGSLEGGEMSGTVAGLEGGTE